MTERKKYSRPEATNVSKQLRADLLTGLLPHAGKVLTAELSRTIVAEVEAAVWKRLATPVIVATSASEGNQ